MRMVNTSRAGTVTEAVMLTDLEVLLKRMWSVAM